MSEKDSLYDSVIRGIKELGFPIVMSIALLYNGWTTQNYLISAGEKRDTQINALNDALIKLAQTQNEIGKMALDNNRMLHELSTDSVVRKMLDDSKRRKQ